MNKSQEYKAHKWCKTNGWTNIFFQDGQFYAFPPDAVIPQPLPKEVQQKGNFPIFIVDIPSRNKRVQLLLWAALIVASSILRSIVTQSPWLVLSHPLKSSLSMYFYGLYSTFILIVFLFCSTGLIIYRRPLVINMEFVLPCIFGVLTAEFCRWIKVIFGVNF